MTATVRKANNAIQFCGLAMVKRSDGRKKEEVEGQHGNDGDDDRDAEARGRCGAEDDQEQRQCDGRRAHIRQHPEEDDCAAKGG